MTPGALGGAAAVLLALAALASVRPAAAALTECRVAGIANSVQCGVIQRALDPARPSGPSIAIHYVVVPALARRKLPDPVFLLAGGPGQSAISLAALVLPLFGRLNNRRDIVFVDQRGTGRSAPLNCADDSREPLAEQSDTESQIRRLQQCERKLRRLPYGADGGLRFFTTPLAMQDLDAIRREIGAERINLVGVSYGTRAGLDYQRQFPQALRRSVLDGVAPPDMALPASFSTDGQAVFDALLADCETDLACQRAYPRLRADWAALLASLPRPVTVLHPLTGEPERLILTRDRVLGAVRGPLYSPPVAAALPAAITAAAQGRFDALTGLGALLGSRKAAQPAMGMHFSVVCAEDLPKLAASADRPGADFGNSAASLYERVCAQWPRGAVPAAFYELPVSRSPVLLLSGGLDPATPPRHAARVAAALGNKALSVVVPNAGHGVLGIGCMRDVLFRFIDAADDAAALAVDASCVKAIPLPPVFEPVGLPAKP